MGDAAVILNWYIFNETAVRWAKRHYLWIVNIGSGSGFVPTGTRPLPEPMLTQSYVIVWRHWATMSVPGILRTGPLPTATGNMNVCRDATVFCIKKWMNSKFVVAALYVISCYVEPCFNGACLHHVHLIIATLPCEVQQMTYTYIREAVLFGRRLHSKWILNNKISNASYVHISYESSTGRSWTTWGLFYMQNMSSCANKVAAKFGDTETVLQSIRRDHALLTSHVWERFRITGLLWGESTGWFLSQKSNNAMPLCFLKLLWAWPFVKETV